MQIQQGPSKFPSMALSMKRRHHYVRFCVLLLPLLCLALTPPGHAQQNDPGDDEKEEQEHHANGAVEHTPPPEPEQSGGSMGRHATNIQVDSNSIGGDDEYSIIRLRNNNQSDAYCMDIKDPTAHVPSDSKGDAGFGQPCEPGPGAPASLRCRRFEHLEYEDAQNTWKDCWKPTHFWCDPITKTCICAKDGIVISPIRFQVGSLKGPNKTHGVCMIRPTFDAMEGIECAPGTEKFEVILDEEADPVEICGCSQSEAEPDKFDSSNPDWWACSGGRFRVEVDKRLCLAVAAYLYLLLN